MSFGQALLALLGLVVLNNGRPLGSHGPSGSDTAAGAATANQGTPAQRNRVRAEDLVTSVRAPRGYTGVDTSRARGVERAPTSFEGASAEPRRLEEAPRVRLDMPTPPPALGPRPVFRMVVR